VRAALPWVALEVLACGGTAPAPTVAPAPGSAGVRIVEPIAPAADLTVAPSEEDVAVPISRGNPSWGSRTALVTIVEFADFECPFCARAEATLLRIREAYGAETVRIVWKNSPLPFHRNAKAAAEAGAGVLAMAGVSAFWKFHDAALRSSSSLGTGSYERWAREAGVLDIDGFRAGLARHAWADAIDKDANEGKALGVFGTPTFFVNGLPLAGALPFPTFQGVIDSQIGAARAKLAGGTPGERLYAELVRDNRETASGEEDDEVDDPKTVYKVPLDKSPVRGSPAALVTIVEFADYECPFCARVESTLKALRQDYGQKLRLVFKDDPLSSHAHAEPAAEAALEVRAERGDAAFWAMHDDLMGGATDMSDAALAQAATRLGASADAVKGAIAHHAHRKSIEDDLDLAEDLEVRGTPQFFINGRRLVGAQPKEKFSAVIDEQIQRAEEAMARGTKPELVYDELVRGGKGPVEPERKSLPAGFAARGPARGSVNGKVTVHEWSDFQCPFCKLVEPTLQRLLGDYGTKVKLVWHDLPLPAHPDAALAARAAREAFAQKGAAAFWVIHDDFFSHQSQLARDDLDGYARQLKLDMGKWNAALDSDAHQGEIEADKEAADGMSIDGTPGFVIVATGAQSGYFISGAQGYSRFRRLVDRALAEAK
jgi:protein-disulfide isomerase